MSQTYRMALRASRPGSTGPRTVNQVEPTKQQQSQPTRPSPLPHPAGHSSATTNSDSSASQTRTLSVDHPEYVPPLLAGIRLHLLPIKLDAMLPEYSRKVVTLGGKLVPLPPTVSKEEPTHPDKMTLPLDYPHVVLTALKGRPRLSRLLNGTLVDTLDIVDIVWIDEVWKTAQDWVWGRPLSAGLGSEPDPETQGVEDGTAESQVDTGFAKLQSSSFPLPGLPDRQPYRIPNTSLTVLERIRNRDSLAVCEASDVAVCLKETMSRGLGKEEASLGKRKRQEAEEQMDSVPDSSRVKTEAIGRERKRRTDVHDLVKGFSVQSLDLNPGVPGYLAHLQSEDVLRSVDPVKTESDLGPLQRTLPIVEIGVKDQQTPGDGSRKAYRRMGKKVSMHVDHPQQDRQILSISKEEQVVEKAEVIDGVQTLRPLAYDVDLEDIPSLSIQRCSPLICVNDDIVCTRCF
jgi:hypothetical protein